MEFTIALNLALQIVFEYPDWNDEHVSEVLDLFETEPCDFGELRSLCSSVQTLKDEGLEYKEVKKKLTDSPYCVE